MKENNHIKFISSGKIAELEALLEAKKEQKRKIEMKYKLIVDYVMQECKEEISTINLYFFFLSNVLNKQFLRIFIFEMSPKMLKLLFEKKLELQK
jgi:hypothetical protein